MDEAESRRRLQPHLFKDSDFTRTRKSRDVDSSHSLKKAKADSSTLKPVPENKTRSRS